MKSIDPIQRESLKIEILIEMEAVTVNLPVQVQPQLEDPRNRQNKKMSLECDSDEDNDASAQNLSVKKELENYINEPKLQEDSDPLLDFWKFKVSKKRGKLTSDHTNETIFLSCVL